MAPSARTVPITTLPNALEVQAAVDIAYANEITKVVESVERGASVLVRCEKELALFFLIAVRGRLRRLSPQIPMTIVDGRPFTAQEIEALEGQGERPAGSTSARMVQKIALTLRGGDVSQKLLVLMHLDIITTTQSGLSVETRDAIPLLYENPEARLLAFADPSFELPRSIEQLFSVVLPVSGISRDALPKIITQREAKSMHAKELDVIGLYKYVSGLNAVAARKLFLPLASLREAPASRSLAKEVYARLRVQTSASSDVEVPNVRLHEDIAGYEGVKTRIESELLALLRSTATLSTTADVEAVEKLLPRGLIFFGPPGTGKTLFAKAMATELDATVQIVSGPELKSKWVGQSLPYEEEVLVVLNGQARRMPIGELVEGHCEGDRVEAWTADDQGRAILAPVTGFFRHTGPDYVDVLVTQTGREVRVTGGHSLFVHDGERLVDVIADDVVVGETRVAVPIRLAAPETLSVLDLTSLLAEADVAVEGYQETLATAEAVLGRTGTEDALGHPMPRMRSGGQPVRVELRALRAVMNRAGIDEPAAGLRVRAGSRARSLPARLPLDEDLGEFLGMWAADGSFCEHGVRLSVHRTQADHYRALAERLFGHVTVGQTPGGECVDLMVTSTLVHRLLRVGLGLLDGSERKRVPAAIFLARLPVVAAFLRGYFTGDGTFNGKYVEATTTSRGLAGDIATLLQYFGIGARLRRRNPRGFPNGRLQHRVRFGWTRWLRVFADRIGFADQRQAALRAYLDGIRLLRDVQTPAAHLREDVLLDLVVEKRREPLGRPHVYDIGVPGTERFVAGYGNVLVHNSEQNIREVFRKARASAPAVIVFDEIDSFARQRGGGANDSGVGDSMVNQLLTEMDGFHSESLVFVVATTNYPESLDGALLRPGRFELLIEIPAPGPADRAAIARLYNEKLGLGMKADLITHLVRRTEGLADPAKNLPFTGDHIDAVCRALKRVQLQRPKNQVLTAEDIDNALKRRIREDLVMSAAEEQTVAVHEAGHALVGMLYPTARRPVSIAITPDVDQNRLGGVEFAPHAQPHALTREHLRGDIAIALGGRVAEWLIYGTTSSGAANDLIQANETARAMVQQLAMGPRNSLLVFLKGSPPSATHQQQADLDVEAILKQENKKVDQLLRDNLDLLQALVAILLKEKRIELPALASLLAEHPPKIAVD